MSNWKYFSEDELKCKGTGECNMDPEFMEKLVALREEYDSPMIITSGYRSEQHNTAIGGSSKSAHLHGCAVDVKVSGSDAHRLMGLAFEHGFSGIGVAQRGAHGSRFIHIDTMTGSDEILRPTVWSYK
tara:strand:+ start:225 stop:608 length:384 start_codon:yes stop_codon:yes gene_type:complete